MTDCAAVERLVRQAIGFDAESTGRSAFEKTVRAALDCTEDCTACVRELCSSPAALEALIEQVVVPETWFFRDRAPFVWLAEAMRGRVGIRILSAPCSTGEEPYSIAMALWNAGFPSGSFHIDAVDVSRRALHVAREACYGPSSFRGDVGQDGILQPVGNRLPAGFAVDRRITAAVDFRHGNLCDPNFLAGERPYDAIFCRNVLIYMAPEARTVVLGHLARLLAPEGVLFAGHSEMAALLNSGYVAEPHPGAFACRRRPLPPEPVPAEQPRTAAGPPEEPEDLLERVRDLADRGELEQASALCDCLVRQNASVEPLYLKGLIEQARGRLDAAEMWLRKTLYLAPDHYEALIHMSNLEGSRGDAERSALFLERARRARQRREDERG